jgi:molybdopterin-guanine dinucleotide biosynthesis protein A
VTGDAGVAAAAVSLAGGRGSRLGGVRKADLVVGGRRLLDLVIDACAGCAPIIIVGEADLAVPAGVLRTREEPPFAGPAAGLAAGLAAALAEVGGGDTMPEWMLCLGCDQPGAADAVPALTRAAATASPDVDAISARASSAQPGSTARPTPGTPTPSTPTPGTPTRSELREVTSDIRVEPREVRVGDGDSDPQIEWMLSILRTEALTKAIADRGEARLVDCSMRRLLAPLRWAHAPVSHHATDDIDTWEDHARWLRRDEAT